MYAVIETGGKQYRVQAGDFVEIEKIEDGIGGAVHFDKILLVAKPGTESSQIWLGKPYLAGAKVEAEVVGQGRGEKVTIIKMKRRKQYRRTQGHRQFQTQLIITSLTNGAGESATLSTEDKKTKLAKFITDLAPKGLPMTPKTLGSRKRLAAAAAGTGEKKLAKAPVSSEAQAPASNKTAAEKTTAKKTPAQPKKKAE